MDQDPHDETVRPIRPDVEPMLDVEREILDWVRDQIKTHRAHNGGKMPRSVAFVAVAEDRGDAKSTANSWSPGDDNSSRLHTCSVGSAMLLHRALGL